jgi:hypothetical protein
MNRQLATAEVAALRADLRDAEKDRMSLANAKARLQVGWHGVGVWV